MCYCNNNVNELWINNICDDLKLIYATNWSWAAVLSGSREKWTAIATFWTENGRWPTVIIHTEFLFSLITSASVYRSGGCQFLYGYLLGGSVLATASACSEVTGLGSDSNGTRIGSGTEVTGSVESSGSLGLSQKRKAAGFRRRRWWNGFRNWWIMWTVNSFKQVIHVTSPLCTSAYLNQERDKSLTSYLSSINPFGTSQKLQNYTVKFWGRVCPSCHSFCLAWFVITLPDTLVGYRRSRRVWTVLFRNREARTAPMVVWGIVWYDTRRFINCWWNVSLEY